MEEEGEEGRDQVLSWLATKVGDPMEDRMAVGETISNGY